MLRMGSQANPVSTSQPSTQETGMESRVQAMWEQMNKGLTSKTVKLFSNNCSGAIMNTPKRKLNDNWITYLGFTAKKTGSATEDAQQKGSSDEDKKVAAMWEEMNKGVSKRTLKPFSNKSSSTMGETSLKNSENWMNYLAMGTNSKAESSVYNVPQEGIGGVQNGNTDEARRLAAAALSAVKDAAAAAAVAGRGKIEITEVRDFVGQEIEVRKLVDADSKEAVEKAKTPVPSAVDAVLEQIKKKPKLSVLDKTKKDWGEFKEENKGMEDELDAYKKSSNQYLDKVSFLQRADYREFERERDARLALQSRRKPDNMREDP